MDDFEYQLRVLVNYTSLQIGVNAFALYQPGYLTIACFEPDGQLNVLADTKLLATNHDTFSKLYELVQHRIRELDHVDVDVVIEY